MQIFVGASLLAITALTISHPSLAGKLLHKRPVFVGASLLAMQIFVGASLLAIKSMAPSLAGKLLHKRPVFVGASLLAITGAIMPSRSPSPSAR